MGNKNYQKEMETRLAALPPGTPLLLHACCAPCASAVLERLGGHLAITLYFDNPNIQPYAEYCRRRDEAKRLAGLIRTQYPLQFAEAPYDEAAFLQAAKGLEGAPEGGARCTACFTLRLSRAALAAKERGIAWFATTLSISPHKNAGLLNTLGTIEAEKQGLRFLVADFKKQDGYKRSIELSKTLGLYRQSYCGCAFALTNQLITK